MMFPIYFEPVEELKVCFETGTIIDEDLETYEGPYVIIPTVEEQGFETYRKKMIDDLTVTEIPYMESSNPGGGKTVNIAYL